MLCQECHKRPASVHITRIVNDNKVEMYLCRQCAEAKKYFNEGPPFNFNINDFFSGIINYANSSPYVHAAVPLETKCDKCGMTYDEFKSIGKLGCSKCYEVFGDRLNSVIRRLHGTSEHRGKVPKKLSRNMEVAKEIKMLKEALNRAIENEEYEKAAELRDKIRNLEANQQ